MKVLHVIAPFLLLAAVTFAVDPLIGGLDAGAQTHGLELELRTSTPVYSIGSMPNLWLILRNTNVDKYEQTIPYDEEKVGYGYIDVTDSHGNKSVISHFSVSDGMMGYGFEGGLGAVLQSEILRPDTYTLQWKIGDLQSNIITMKVTEATSEL